ncbi:hypothetical protein RA28_10665, partial [Ruegeria sp. ANG-S4]|uniref:PA14 domain-containing protein n=1 Tax=Ruegeria sp. ANG-S4 TaxID=1577904 RepID=UPI00057E7689
MMGLFAQYFTLGSGISSLSEIDFTGTPDATGVVDSLDTYLSTGGMWRDGPRDKFAASHVGDLNVYEDGEYTFYLTSDDGSALYIDGKLVISNDGLHAAREQDVTLNLAAGAHKIEIFYFENKGLSTLQLEWVGPDSNGRREVISGDSLSHTVAGEDDSDDTSADNGGSTPDTPDDGDTVVDNGGSTPDTPDSGDTDTGSGSTPDTPDDGPTKTNQGLLARGFVIPAATTSLTQIDFEADSAATFQTTELNSRFRFDPFWKNGPSDYFAVQYAGDLNVATGGKYTFYLTSDDGSALYVDGQLVIDNDGRHPDVSRIITLDLSAGAHDIEVRYFESGAAQTLILEWVGPDSNGRREVISGDSL